MFTTLLTTVWINKFLESAMACDFSVPFVDFSNKYLALWNITEENHIHEALYNSVIVK